MCIVLGKNAGSALCARQDFRGLIVVRELGKTEGACRYRTERDFVNSLN